MAEPQEHPDVPFEGEPESTVEEGADAAAAGAEVAGAPAKPAAAKPPAGAHPMEAFEPEAELGAQAMPSLPEEHILQRCVEINLKDVDFDVQLQHGQVRAMTTAHVAEVKGSLLQLPPHAPIQAVLVAKDITGVASPRRCGPPDTLLHPTGKKFWVLGGQHSLKAALEIRADLIAEGKPVPRWATVCNAVTLWHDTPLRWRKLVAGQHQLRQQDVSHPPLSRTAAALLELLQTEPDTPLQEATHLASIMGA